MSMSCPQSGKPISRRRVSRAPTRRGRPLRHQIVPQGGRLAGGHDQFGPALPGVPGARHERPDAAVSPISTRNRLGRRPAPGRAPSVRGGGPAPRGGHGVLVAEIHHGGVAGAPRQEASRTISWLTPLGRITRVVVGHPPHDDVVDDCRRPASSIIVYWARPGPIRLRSLHSMLSGDGDGVRAGQREPAQVGDVEDPAPAADGLVLRQRALVLQRHVPPAEVGETGSGVGVDGVQRGAERHGGNSRRPLGRIPVGQPASTSPRLTTRTGPGIRVGSGDSSSSGGASRPYLTNRWR